MMTTLVLYSPVVLGNPKVKVSLGTTALGALDHIEEKKPIL